ncbi:NAD(P)H-dependent oxidoreductase subunit E [Serratia sp. DD3]|uniref:NAD(P)H-dependent oxidoreductase subunit E n=1 Tax=Serratia sp. DD3 TaxID=1410619 RepID=UPI0003C4EFCC|nr:NAD(P)H-dependent oxidoreductase subunit E [Serratia sp. DD3]KEY59667.1 NAD-reducing hydrogenase HoxS subunit alpha [Serratia sp. DD3]
MNLTSPLLTALRASLYEDIEAILVKHRHDKHALVQILREVQESIGWLPRQLLKFVAAELGVTLAHVEGVATFYRFFHTKPVGEYRVLFSDNITDRMQGSVELLADLCARLQIERGQVRADGRVSVDTCSCTGLCDQGPALLINHQQIITHLDAERVAQIARLINARVPVSEWPPQWSLVDNYIRRADVLLAEKSQPGAAIAAALALGASGVLGEMTISNLRGRGGAGFVTATKWTLCRDAPGSEHYIACNADEGEPGTFKDRVLLSHDPHKVFEGMTIAALAIGARHGMLYLRGEYRYLLDSLHQVLQRRREMHLLGKSILGEVGFDFDIVIHVGAGAYVCGEESALIESLEGKRGTPRIRPPYPTEHGYLGQPTVVDNVETLCAATHVVLRGGAWWATIGTAKSTGSQLHSVSGDCERPGIYEYPMGVSVDQILQDCGARDTQAVQVGGPSDKCLSVVEFGRRIAFEDVPTAGAFMVLDRSRDMFDVAHNYARFFAEESCGLCTPCRVGTALVLKSMDKIAEGRGSRSDVDLLLRIDTLMHGTAHCGLGGSACNALHDTLTKFRPSYEQRLHSLQFEPAFDLNAELAVAKRWAGSSDSSTHQEKSE